MPKLTTHVPKLCHHAKGQAFVKIAGQPILAWRNGQPLTYDTHDRLVLGPGNTSFPQKSSSSSGTQGRQRTFV